MSETTRELSAEIMIHIQRMLNLQIQTNGAISINNKTIWDGFLHKMNNEVWLGCLETLWELSQAHPQYFQPFHVTAIDRGLTAIYKYAPFYDRVLDMRNRHLDHKKIAWQCLMTIREVLNNIEGIRLPNDDKAKVKTHL